MSHIFNIISPFVLQDMWVKKLYIHTTHTQVCYHQNIRNLNMWWTCRGKIQHYCVLSDPDVITMFHCASDVLIWSSTIVLSECLQRGLLTFSVTTTGCLSFLTNYISVVKSSYPSSSTAALSLFIGVTATKKILFYWV